jgi:GntR family transcriptional repressor for pyruvate dehydrogenase complex
MGEIDRMGGVRLNFGPVARTERLADRVADAIKQSIVSGALAAGDRLPPERELCEQFQVSRTIVREAVRSLIAKGLVDYGPRRGIIVSPRRRDVITESLTLYLRGDELDYGKLMEVRTVIEVETAGLAAERCDAQDIDSLRDGLALLRLGLGPKEAALADLEFHQRIAATTGNEFFEMVLNSVREVLITAQLPTLANPEIIESSIRDHTTIFDQIAAKEPERAREAMRAHMQHGRRSMRAVLLKDPAKARVA